VVWESRDWAKWTEEERKRFYLDSAPFPAASAGEGRGSLFRRFRSAVWLTGVVGGLIAFSYIAPLVHNYGPRDRETPYSAWGLKTPGLPGPGSRPIIVYGWRVEAPAIDVPIDPGLVAAYRGHTVLCIVRRRTASGWFCDTVAFLPPGRPYMALPADSKLTAAPCSQPIAPGGKPFPCPGGWTPSSPTGVSTDLP